MSMETTNYGLDQREKVMTVKNWLITSLILMIPIANIVMLFVWAFGDSANKNKSNYAKASLIMMAIFIVLYAIFAIAFFSLFADVLSKNTTF
ncbi:MULTISPECIES: hypothetical protein [Paenibacillus]|uniref:Uncharacterized protein n=1 Tax=Paenibacillus chondroitinus TaxID=59842 RepID=A0ABU6DCA4_9BACL|nr:MULTISPECIES: hypothetical protein [Paenibacillus]MCY9659997.1 hypothetical protein [Paenibacillus anseongense]MEB4795385.1 hypothetical protein [Paenibacillus chondroitinus]